MARVPLIKGAHYQGPLLGNDRAGGGLFEDMPIGLVDRSTHSVFFQDFHTDLSSNWVNTEIGTSGTLDILQDRANGVLRLASTTINEGYGSFQYTGAELSSEGVAEPAAGRSIAFEARVSAFDWVDSDWYIGLGMTDTTFMSVAGALLATGADTHVGFHHLVTAAAIPKLTYASTAVASLVQPTSTQTAALTNAGTDGNPYYLFGIRIEGTTNIRFYLDRKPLTGWLTAAAALGDAMTPTFAMVANGASAALDIDYVLVCQTR